MADTLIKICGLRDAAMARVAIEAGADFVGLVFVKKSPRFVDMATAKAIADAVGDNAQTVGLFVDEDTSRINDIAGEVGLDIVQLHGDEPPEVLRQLAPRPIIRALHVGHDPAPWNHALALLYDTPQKAGDLPGGSGETFDWDQLTNLDRANLPPLMLAGGLTADNVAEAIRVVQPWAVDVSSGVESSRGVKDANLIRDFCKAVRRA